jgi:hypothetical protein
LNGDGDTDDTVPIIFHAPSGEVRNLGIAMFIRPVIDGDLVVFSALESGENRDLNGDGDTDDPVLHFYDALEDRVGNLRKADFEEFLDEHLVAFNVSEGLQGFTDLNGDGDTGDSVLHVAGFPCRPGKVLDPSGQVVPTLRVNRSPGSVLVSPRIRPSRSLSMRRPGDPLRPLMYFGSGMSHRRPRSLYPALYVASAAP